MFEKKESTTHNTVLCVVAYVIGFRVASPAFRLSHLLQRKFPQSATTHSPDTLCSSLKKRANNSESVNFKMVCVQQNE